MAIPAQFRGGEDSLILGTLRSPMLNEFMASMVLRAEMMSIAEEIKRRHLARLPRDSGNLARTARVTSHRSQTHEDRRWEAEYSIGSPQADYANIVEAEGHYLAETLREMGFNTGDLVSGPTGRLRAEESEPTVTLYHRTRRADVADAIISDGFKPTFRPNSASEDYIKLNKDYGFFTKQVEGQEGYGDNVLKVNVPRSAVEDDPWSGHFRVNVANLQGLQFQRHVDEDEGDINAGDGTSVSGQPRAMFQAEQEMRDAGRRAAAAAKRERTPTQRDDSAYRSENDLAISDAADALINSRPGSKAATKKLQALQLEDKGHYLDRGEFSGTARNAVNLHNQRRAAAGLDPVGHTEDTLPPGMRAEYDKRKGGG